MTPFPAYTEADIRNAVGAEIFERGRDYFDSGMVQQLVMRGETLHAIVEGSQYTPYQVNICFAGDEIVAADCTCPYDWDGWCKHIVAALLAAKAEPASIEERATVATLINALTRDELATLLQDLLAEQPDLVNTVESWLAQQKLATLTTQATTPATATAQPAIPAPPLDSKTMQQTIRKALRGLNKAEAAERLMDQVQTLLYAGEGRNALTMLQALTDEYVAALSPMESRYNDYYDEYEDDGSDSVLDALDALWAEVILSLDLSKAEQQVISDQIEDWTDQVAEREIEATFSTTQLALQYGWDYPPLQCALRGEFTVNGVWADKAPYGADALAQVRLTVLERQGRTEEYLNLALAEGQLYAYVLMLAKVGRVQAAVSEGFRLLNQAPEVLALAHTLQQQGAEAEAIQIAQHGLSHAQGSKHALAIWLRDRHLSRGEVAQALETAIIALGEQPDMDAYRQLQILAGDGWSKVRTQALAALRGKRTFGNDMAKAEIFLSEELWDDAIHAVDGDYGSEAVVMVMRRLYQQRPDWVIQRATRFAELIMDAGKAQRYEDAVHWLTYAKQAYLAANRGDEWRHYLGNVRATHQRKYKLIGLLKRL